MTGNFAFDDDLIGMQRAVFATIAILGAATYTEVETDQRHLLLSDLDGTLVGGPGGTSKVCYFNIPFATLLATKILNEKTHTHTQHTHTHTRARALLSCLV